MTEEATIPTNLERWTVMVSYTFSSKDHAQRFVGDIEGVLQDADGIWSGGPIRLKGPNPPVIHLEQSTGEDALVAAAYIGECHTCETQDVWLWDINGEDMCQECVCE